MKRFFSHFLGTFNVTKITIIGFKMSKIWLMEMKGVSVRFKYKKIVFVLKLKMYVHWFKAFALQRPFLEV